MLAPLTLTMSCSFNIERGHDHEMPQPSSETVHPLLLCPDYWPQGSLQKSIQCYKHNQYHCQSDQLGDRLLQAGTSHLITHE
jgi:hypothetical protein